VKRGCLIVIAGIDGSGKSWLLEHLNRTVALHENIVVVTRDTEPMDKEYGVRLASLATLLWNYSAELDVRRFGDDHLILLMASWFYLFEKAVILPVLASGRDVVTDVWSGKYVARLRAKRVDSAAIFSRLLEYDGLVHLDLNAAEAARRRSAFRTTEADNSTLDIGGESFIEFQSRVSVELAQMRTGSWRSVDACGVAEVVGGMALCHIRELIANHRALR
jgi:thymidylate kinase